ncbi:alpha/beta hydrolase [Psychromarinibacter sp. C21-152]|uniref:Palmitoyl-protein thioesterase ABHD10, mitochondrial n=1 Tax=Psychromarinibacter sediminicola TaxID=3033385 RepID=A0AAE3T8J5_9RHOB|nr:alpha/beta hydrolase [Psychromarinibacter sediminicola]MDF0600129.1 alpha/beta hydrolase [Psychromarinibacter sediminicola]
MPSYLDTPQGRRIAYHLTEGRGPTVVFLGGFRSDMAGTKAVHLEAWAQARGQGFLRLDYSGHGESSGAFEEGSIGDWAEDAFQVINATVEGSVVLVGSSMGGWIALILSRRLQAKVRGLVGIAAAPDFTEDSMWAGFDEAQRQALEAEGRVEQPSDYSDEPYVITRRLIEEGRSQLVLRDALPLPYPVRLLQGTADEDVDRSVALRLLDHAEGDDIRLTLVKGADHRFSTPDCLALIERSIVDVLDLTKD